MSTAAEFETTHEQGPLARAEGWLDERGKGAWIAAMVIGFILFWPVGLFLLFYMIWSKRMFNKTCHHRHTRHREAERMNRRHGLRTSGNSAFDAYKAETLQRLMDEQEQFEAFLERLRAAKDQSEFDQFMDERASAVRAPKPADEDAAPELEEPRA